MSNRAAVDQLAGDLTTVAARLADLAPVQAEAARILTPLAATAARKRSGNMARLITATPTAVEARAPYSRLVHDGLRRITPNPFFPAALDAGSPQIADRLAAHGDNALEVLAPTYQGT